MKKSLINSTSKNKLLIVIILLFSIIYFQCAASTEEISIESEPTNANVIVEDTNIAVTPTKIQLSRKNPIFRIELEGYEPKTVTLDKNINILKILGTVLFAGILSGVSLIVKGGGKGNEIAALCGFAVSSGIMVTYGFTCGYYYDLSPNKVNVKLKVNF